MKLCLLKLLQRPSQKPPPKTIPDFVPASASESGFKSLSSSSISPRGIGARGESRRGSRANTGNLQKCLVEASTGQFSRIYTHRTHYLTSFKTPVFYRLCLLIIFIQELHFAETVFKFNNSMQLFSMQLETGAMRNTLSSLNKQERQDQDNYPGNNILYRGWESGRTDHLFGFASRSRHLRSTASLLTYCCLLFISLLYEL